MGKKRGRGVRWARRCVIGVVSVIILVAIVCRGRRGARRPEEAAVVDERDVQTIISLLEQMPDWGTRGTTTPDKRARIEAAVRRIAAHDLDTIRAAMVRHLRDRRGIGSPVLAETKLFVLTKYLFDFPETVRLGCPHFEFDGGWIGDMPLTGDPYSHEESDLAWIRWPWSEDEEGTWRLTGSLDIGRTPWLPIEAFDYHRKTFGRRDVSKKRRPPRTPPPAHPLPRDVDAVVSVLGAMPPWCGPNVAHPATRAKIEAAAQEIAAYSTETIRAAMERYSKENRTAGQRKANQAELRLYVLNKYLFDFPEVVRVNSATRRHDAGWFGGWFGDVEHPKPSDWVWIRWPWAEQEDGTWLLFGAPGASVEGPYDPLEAFDYYRQTYPRRDFGRKREAARSPA